MVDTLGEDRVLDFFLAQVGASPPEKRETAGAKVGWWIVGFLAQNPWLVFMGAQALLGPVAGTIVLVALVCLGGVVHLVNHPGDLATAVVWTIGIVVVGGVGVGLWFTGPWIFGGVRQWWGWLGGHF